MDQSRPAEDNSDRGSALPKENASTLFEVTVGAQRSGSTDQFRGNYE